MNYEITERQLELLKDFFRAYKNIAKKQRSLKKRYRKLKCYQQVYLVYDKVLDEK